MREFIIFMCIACPLYYYVIQKIDGSTQKIYQQPPADTEIRIDPNYNPDDDCGCGDGNDLGYYNGGATAPFLNQVA
jgi:hypothetical protein